MRLRRAVLFVKDLEAMVDFYGPTLGLPRVAGPDTPGWVELDAGGTTLGLHAIPAAIAERIEIGSPPLAREETPLKLVFAVPDVNAERARLVALGVRLADVTPWGACDGIDPEGNVFQIAGEP